MKFLSSSDRWKKEEGTIHIFKYTYFLCSSSFTCGIISTSISLTFRVFFFAYFHLLGFGSYIKAKACVPLLQAKTFKELKNTDRRTMKMDNCSATFSRDHSDANKS